MSALKLWKSGTFRIECYKVLYEFINGRINGYFGINKSLVCRTLYHIPTCTRIRTFKRATIAEIQSVVDLLLKVEFDWSISDVNSDDWKLQIKNKDIKNQIHRILSNEKYMDYYL